MRLHKSRDFFNSKFQQLNYTQFEISSCVCPLNISANSHDFLSTQLNFLKQLEAGR